MNKGIYSCIYLFFFGLSSSPKRYVCLRFLPIRLKISRKLCVFGAKLEPKCDRTTYQFVQTKQADQIYQGEPCFGGNVPGCCFLFAEARWQKPARAVHISSFWRENSCGDCSIQTDLSSSSSARASSSSSSTPSYSSYGTFSKEASSRKKNPLLVLLQLKNILTS